MNYVIFDDHTRPEFLPLTATRCIGDLRAGIFKLRQRLEAYFGVESTVYIMDEELVPLYRERHPDWLINNLPAGECLLVNSRLRISNELLARLESLEPDTTLHGPDGLLACRLNAKTGSFTRDDLAKITRPLPVRESEGRLWQHPWELIAASPELITEDFDEFFYDQDSYVDPEPGVTILNPYHVWLGDDITLKPGVVLDATDGPVVVDDGAIILANAVVVGPAYIGKNCTINPLTRVLGGSSLGKHCKIGGEVAEVIFQGYANKQHDGFLGHAYVGEWVNLGAGTCNSDLKNNYRPVKMYSYPQKNTIDTGLTFLGCLLGDHTKTAINSTLYTGAVAGVGVNWASGKPLNGFAPDFTWDAPGTQKPYRLDDFLHTATAVKARRGLTLSQAEIQLLTNLYHTTGAGDL